MSLQVEIGSGYFPPARGGASAALGAERGRVPSGSEPCVPANATDRRITDTWLWRRNAEGTTTAVLRVVRHRRFVRLCRGRVEAVERTIAWYLVVEGRVYGEGAGPVYDEQLGAWLPGEEPEVEVLRAFREVRPGRWRVEPLTRDEEIEAQDALVRRGR